MDGHTHALTYAHTHTHSRGEALKKCQVFSNTIVPGVQGPLASGGAVGKPALGHCESIYSLQQERDLSRDGPTEGCSRCENIQMRKEKIPERPGSRPDHERDWRRGCSEASGSSSGKL